MREDEGGYIVVETLLAFVLYLATILSILTLINISVVQSRVHYAITEACETASMYFYILEATGRAEHMMAKANTAEQTKVSAQNVVDSVNAIIDSAANFDFGGVNDGITEVKDEAQNFSMKKIMATLVTDLEKALFAKTMEALTGHYLNNGIDAGGKAEQTGKEYLKAYGVKNGTLDFLQHYDLGFNSMHFQVNLGTDGCAPLDKDGNVVVAVDYTVRFMIGRHALPFTELRVHQVVKTKAWLGGEGKGYGG